MQEFNIRAYGKSELAMLYFQNANSAHTAVNHLMAWVKRNPELTDKLRGMGYQKTAKYFTAREVRIIVEYLGEP